MTTNARRDGAADADCVGAFAAAPGEPLVPPFDGFARRTRPAESDAVDCIIETVRRYPHEVTIRVEFGDVGVEDGVHRRADQAGVRRARGRAMDST